MRSKFYFLFWRCSSETIAQAYEYQEVKLPNIS